MDEWLSEWSVQFFIKKIKGDVKHGHNWSP